MFPSLKMIVAEGRQTVFLLTVDREEIKQNRSMLLRIGEESNIEA